ncbi:MAG TPA: hypothetical protein VFE72_03020 [Lysobacter sp.]|nr:hypothetical protein [Lysobacter sp.]
MADADPRYPLRWPPGHPRTPPEKRTRAPFKTAPDAAYRNLMDQLRLLGATDVILSSNLKLRQDGAPYAQQPRHNDEAIAIYFKRRVGKKVVDYAMGCDLFQRREHNMHALGLSIEALRGLERWGSTGMVERAFTGFQALPSPDATPWWVEFGFDSRETVMAMATGEAKENLMPFRLAVEAVVTRAYMRRRAETHPDRKGGNDYEFQRTQRAWEQFKAEEGYD